jgi:hypothetical protein
MKFNIKPRIVQFESGLYGIRRFSFNPFELCYQYRDLQDRFWQDIQSPSLPDCFSDDLEKVKKIYTLMNPVVKEIL